MMPNINNTYDINHKTRSATEFLASGKSQVIRPLQKAKRAIQMSGEMLFHRSAVVAEKTHPGSSKMTLFSGRDPKHALSARSGVIRP